MILTIVSFLLVLTVLVIVHELGHFLTAKFFGVKVEEFGFGFPPRAWGKKIGETLYSLNWLPIGGFVKLYGEDEAGGGSLVIKDQKVSDKDQKRAFFTRPVWQRFLIIFAGVFMNFALATVILSYLVIAEGVPVVGHDVMILGIAKNSPAAAAGLIVGERIVSVGSLIITSPDKLIVYVKSHLGKPLRLVVVNKQNVKQAFLITPRTHYQANEGAMGVAVGTNIIVQKYPWFQAPFIGLQEAFSQSWQIFGGLGQLVSQVFAHGQVPQDLAGPVGIAQITGQFVRMGFNATLSLLALLSLNLAILNVLPIPALDGGRLFFIVIEGITRKKVSPKIEGYIHAAGMALLLLLIVLITFHDIFRIVSGGSLLP